MVKHKAVCWVMGILLFVGGLNWGLVGLGSFLETNLNLVNLIFGSVPQLEWVIYILVGLAALAYGYFMLTCKDCACTMSKKSE